MLGAGWAGGQQGERERQAWQQAMLEKTAEIDMCVMCHMVSWFVMTRTMAAAIFGTRKLVISRRLLQETYPCACSILSVVKMKSLASTLFTCVCLFIAFADEIIKMIR